MKWNSDVEEMDRAAFKCFSQERYDECIEWINKICQTVPKASPQITALRSKVDNIRKNLGLPYIFPAELGKAETMDGVYGLLTKSDLKALRYCAVNSRGKCLNIGVFEGLSAYYIASCNPDLEVYGVDAYKGMSAQIDKINHVQVNKARHNLSKLLNVHLIVGLSSKVAQQWTYEIGFLFIDGDHSVQGTVSDFQTWSPFLASDGFIAVHNVYGKVSQSILRIREKDNSHGPDVVCKMMASDPDYEFVMVSGCTEVWRKKSTEKTNIFTATANTTRVRSRFQDPNHAQYEKPEPSRGEAKVAKYCAEACIVFVSYGRPEIAARSYESLATAIAPYRNRVKIIISDATDDEQKMMWARNSDADDVILTPRFTPAATSRNLAMTLTLDKYSPTYLCMVEDDFEYSPHWYPSLVEATDRLYGVISPFDLAYGIFSACDYHIPHERQKEDKHNGVTAYIFGAVAYQRFIPTSHYLTVMRNWDADLLGISYAQTGGQTFRNTMRGFCGAILPGSLSRPIDVDNTASTWTKGKRDPGPPAHSFNLKDYIVVRKAAQKVGFYTRDEK